MSAGQGQEDVDPHGDRRVGSCGRGGVTRKANLGEILSEDRKAAGEAQRNNGAGARRCTGGPVWSGGVRGLGMAQGWDEMYRLPPTRPYNMGQMASLGHIKKRKGERVKTIQCLLAPALRFESRELDHIPRLVYPGVGDLTRACMLLL